MSEAMGLMLVGGELDRAQQRCAPCLAPEDINDHCWATCAEGHLCMAMHDLALLRVVAEAAAVECRECQAQEPAFPCSSRCPSIPVRDALRAAGLLEEAK